MRHWLLRFLHVKKMIESNALTASVGAMFGITEPAIFGVTLVYGIPFLFGMLGSGLGGMFGAITHLAAPGMGTAGIPDCYITLAIVVI